MPTMQQDNAPYYRKFLKPLTAFEERSVEWLIPGYVPRGTIGLLAGDGGSGKTAIMCHLCASISTGNKVFFDGRPDEFCEDDPGHSFFFSSEDGIEEVLKARIKACGGDEKYIHSISLNEDEFRKLRYDSKLLKDIILGEKPKLCIFDPVQGFIDPSVQMSSRNAMRTTLAPLVGICQETKTTVMLICHTNKRPGVYGRNRIADSADLYDISRYVLIAGEKGEDDLHYLAHDKCNYGRKQPSAEFSIDENGTPILYGFSDKGDREYVQNQNYQAKQAPSREEARSFILEFLKNGERMASDLDGAAKARSITNATLSRAKTELKKSGEIEFRATGFGKDKTWYVHLKK